MVLASCKNENADQNILAVVAGVHSVVLQVVVDLTTATNYSGPEQKSLLETIVNTGTVAPDPTTPSPSTTLHPVKEVHQHHVIKELSEIMNREKQKQTAHLQVGRKIIRIRNPPDRLAAILVTSTNHFVREYNKAK